MGELFTSPGGLWRRIPRYLAVAPFLGGRRVLDLGCGGGRAAAWLAAGRTREVVGAEADAETAAHAERALGRPGLSFVEATPTDLPFPDRSFDAVLALGGELLHGGSDTALAEVRRVLAPGGFVAVALDNPARKALPVASEGLGAPGDGSGHALYVALRRRFATVRLVGQVPVMGFLFGDLAQPEGGWPGPAIADELLGGDPGEQDAWLALCWDDGGAAPRFDPTLVKLPFDDLAEHLLAEASERDARVLAVSEQSRQAEDFQARLHELESALQEALAEAGEGPRVDPDATSPGRPAAPVDRDALRLRTDVVARERRIEDLESELGARAARMEEASKLLTALEEAASQARLDAQRTHVELRGERRERDRISAELAVRDQRIQSLEVRVYGAAADEGQASPAEEAWREERERADVLQMALLEREEQLTELEAELMTLRRKASADG